MWLLYYTNMVIINCTCLPHNISLCELAFNFLSSLLDRWSTYSMMILNLVGKPFTIALSIVSIFFRVRTGISTGELT